MKKISIIIILLLFLSTVMASNRAMAQAFAYMLAQEIAVEMDSWTAETWEIWRTNLKELQKSLVIFDNLTQLNEHSDRLIIEARILASKTDDLKKRSLTKKRTHKKREELLYPFFYEMCLYYLLEEGTIETVLSFKKIQSI